MPTGLPIRQPRRGDPGGSFALNALIVGAFVLLASFGLARQEAVYGSDSLALLQADFAPLLAP